MLGTEGRHTPEGEFVEIQGKKVKGIGLGNIFSQGPIKLRSTSVKNKEEPPKQPVKEPHTEKEPPKKVVTLMRCTVLLMKFCHVILVT